MSWQEKLHLFGIRHHGPGSAHSLIKQLTDLQPDLLLLEAPAEAEPLFAATESQSFTPPIALLIYPVDDLSYTVYYPFAVFSPEWQTLKFAQQHHIPLRCMDLPQTHQIALHRHQQAQSDTSSTSSKTTVPDESAELPEDMPEDEAFTMMTDPVLLLAQAAGFEDSERWWEYMVEQRQDHQAVFQGIQEAMVALRQEVEKSVSSDNFQQHRQNLREAWMRKTIRTAIKDGFSNIAVVCGAWHIPALTDAIPAKQDNTLLKGLSKTKVHTTWTIWSYRHLTLQSGYSAGIHAPGWYQHLWETRNSENRSQAISVGWLTKIAHHLREQGIDASTANVIESVRMAETLAALRHKPLPDLEELYETSLANLCFGEEAPLKLINEQLLIGSVFGTVPEDTPMVPLQADLTQLQKRLRLKGDKELKLDLRQEFNLERSHLLHRLRLLEIPWGKLEKARGKGTFKEHWQLQWQPEMTVRLIEMNVWGTTIEQAATQYSRHQLVETTDLADITRLFDQALLANLPKTIAFAMQRLETEAALASDILQLMQALSPLVNVLRYGGIRQFDKNMLQNVIDTLIPRICIGLPGACHSLDDEAAKTLFNALQETNANIQLIQHEQHLQLWQQTLTSLYQQTGVHNLIAGRCCRLLFDKGALSPEQTATQMQYALSAAEQPDHAGAWIEGFLQGSGMMLLYDDKLWQVVDNWVGGLSEINFISLLPLLRRTFATFPFGERRKIGERVTYGNNPLNSTAKLSATTSDTELDTEQAAQVLPLMTQLLGLQYQTIED